MRLTAAVAFCLTAFAAVPSPVADAAMKGDAQTVRKLIAQKSDVNAPQPDGATAIQWASYSNNLELADLLIASGANVKAANRDGATPLYLAANNGSAPMIEKLLKAGADPNEKNPHGETPLMFAARSGNVDAIKMLLDHQAAVNSKESLRGTTALMWATDQKHAEAVRVLAQRGADVSAVSNPDTKGNRAYLAPPVQARLRAALAAGKEPGDLLAPGGEQARTKKAPPQKPEDIVAAADAAAADSSFGRGTDTDGGGLTPLVFAARQDCLECAKVLLEAGANVAGHSLWLDALADGDPEPPLQAQRVPAGARRQSQHRQQRRLDASLSRHRQPQYRRWRLSRAQARHRSSGDHQAASREGRERERPHLRIAIDPRQVRRR